MRYSQGEWLALATGAGGALLPADFGRDRVLALWEALRDGLGFSDILQRLIAWKQASLADLPAFAIAVMEGPDVHVAVRGALRVVGRGAAGDVLVDGENVSTWREERVVRPDELTLAAGSAPDAATAQWWPVSDGIVMAGSLALVSTSSTSAHPVAEPVDAPASRPPVVEPVETPGSAQVSTSSTGAASAPDSTRPTGAAVVKTPAPRPAKPKDATGNTTLVPQEDGTDALHTTTFFASMFAEPNGVAAQAAPGVSTSSTTGSASAAVSTSPTSGPAPDDDHDGLTITVAPGVDDDHDGMTVLGGPAQADPRRPDEPTPPQPAPTGPTVLARTCLACGAANPTQRVTCRACDAPLSGDAARIVRPRLGTLVLPSGDTLPIEHPVVVGRRPEASRFSGDDVPVVVRVDDPHISSTHLKIDLEDWSVLVTNLGLNGTVLRRPGQPDRNLGDGETVLAQVGDVYDIGSGATLGISELA